MRTALIAAALGAALSAASSVRAEDVDLPTAVVDDMNTMFGPQNGFRAFHAKGVVVEGRFRGSAEGRALSKAVLFDGRELPVTVRFSDNGGLPTIPDNSPEANPHGMALKFRLPDGSETDMVTNSLKFFPTATVAEFKELLDAVIASPPGSPKPTKVEQFMAAHPRAPAAFATASTPDSLAHEEYRGINAFVLVNAAGARQAVRYIVSPERVVHLDEAAAKAKGPDFLMQELPERLKAGPVTFRLRAQLAAPGDPTADPSLAWPDDRKLVELGTLTLDRAVPNSREAEKPLLFLPGALTDGIETGDDPMVDIRNGAYAVSFGRRQ